METFLPSEIARLVLGYLKEENCQETSKVFMRECTHLREYVSMLQQGREFSTEVLGLSLKMILDEYGNMKLSRRAQATPALTNLWDKYELMGSQLRQAITPLVNPVSQPVASQLVNTMQTFSRRQGSRNRYKGSRTESVVVVRSEVAVSAPSTASTPPSTPQVGKSSAVNNIGSNNSTLPTILPQPSGTTAVPSVIRLRPGILEGTGLGLSLRSQTPSLVEDDLESLVSSLGGMSSSVCEQNVADVVVNITAINHAENDRLNQALTNGNRVCHRESATPAKIISPTLSCPLSSTQLTSSTPGNLRHTSQQPTGSTATTNSTGATQKSSRQPRRIQPKMITDGAVVSPIRAVTSTSVTSCHATPAINHLHTSTLNCSDLFTVCSMGFVTSHSSNAVVSSCSVPAILCNSGTNALSQTDHVVLCPSNPVTPGHINVPTGAVATIPVNLNTTTLVGGKTTNFLKSFPNASCDSVSCNVAPVISCSLVPVSSCSSVPTTSFNSVPFSSFKSLPVTSFDSVPVVACNSCPVTSIPMSSFSLVPVTSNLVPFTGNQVPVTSDLVPTISCTAHQAQSREDVMPSMTDALSTPSKRRSCPNCAGNTEGSILEPQVPRTPVRSRRHLPKEFNSPRDRRKKAQPCKRRTSTEQVIAPAGASANATSIQHCSGNASTFDLNPVKSDLPEFDISGMLERLISNQAIAEKIAENINRLTSQNASRPDVIANSDDAAPSDGPRAAPEMLSKSQDPNPDSAVENSNVLPFEPNHQELNHQGELNRRGELNHKGILNHVGDNNGAQNAVSVDGTDVMLDSASGAITDARSSLEGNVAVQEFKSEHANLQSRLLHEETIGDLSCTSLLSLSNLDQMTDDAIRFVFDQLCNDPNLDSICNMTYHHTERTEADVISSSALATQTLANHQTPVELLNCAPVTDASNAALTDAVPSTIEILGSPVPNGLEPSDALLASASVGMETRRQYIQVYIPGADGHPDRIDIVEVIGSGVEISSSQLSPENRTSVADGSQKPPHANGGQETVNQNPILLSCQDMSYYLHSSTDVASTQVDGFSSGWSSSDPKSTLNKHVLTTTTVAYFGDFVSTAVLSQATSEDGVGGDVESSLNTRPQVSTIAEHDLGQLQSSLVPGGFTSSPEGSHLSSRSPAVESSSAHLISSAIEPGPQLCKTILKSASDDSPGELTESDPLPLKSGNKKEHRTGKQMKTPAVELKLDEKTGSYHLTDERLEKRKKLGFGVPGKTLAQNTSIQSFTTPAPNSLLTCDVGQLQLMCSAREPVDGSSQVFKEPALNFDCIAISEVPFSSFTNQTVNVDENPNHGGKDKRGRNLSLKQFRVLSRGRGPSTPSSVATGPISFTGIAGLPTPPGSAVDVSTSKGITGLSGSAVSPVASTGSAGLPTPSLNAGPCTPIESATIPSTPTEIVNAPSSFTGNVRDATGAIQLQNSNAVTNERFGLTERSVSREKSRNTRQAKSVVYFMQDALTPGMQNQEHSNHSSLSSEISVNKLPCILSNNVLTNEKPRKAPHKSKKKSTHISDSDKNKSDTTRKKGKTCHEHNSISKRSDETGNTEKSIPVKHLQAEKNTDRAKKKGKKSKKVPLSNTKQLDYSSDDDMTLANLLNLDVHMDKQCRRTEADAVPTVTKSNSPNATLLKTVSPKKRRQDKQTDSYVRPGNDFSSKKSSRVSELGGKAKASKEKHSKKRSTTPLSSGSLTDPSSCSYQLGTPNLSGLAVLSGGERDAVSARSRAASVNSDKVVESGIVSANCTILHKQKNSVGNSVKAKWSEFKRPESQQSLSGGVSASNMDINSNVSTLPTGSLTGGRCRSLEHILIDLQTSKSSVKTSDVASSKSPTTSLSKTLIVSSQKTSIISSQKSGTMSPLETSLMLPPRSSASVFHNGRAPAKSVSTKTKKSSPSSQSDSLSTANHHNTHKDPHPKTSKTKKQDEARVEKQPVPSLLSRASKVREASNYTMSCDTLLSMPSSFESLLQMCDARKGMVSHNDDLTENDLHMEHLEMSAVSVHNSSSVAPKSIPSESCHGVGNGGYDDVVIASALLSLSSTVPVDSSSVPQNVLTKPGNTSTEVASACCKNRITTDPETWIGTDQHSSLPSMHYWLDCNRSETNLTNSAPTNVNLHSRKYFPSLLQEGTACNLESSAIDLSVAARDLHLDRCCTNSLRTCTFSSPELGLVLSIDEGSRKTPSTPSNSASACPSVSESHTDENPGSCSEEISKPTGKRRRSSSADSDRQTKRNLKKKLKGLDINAFLKQLSYRCD